MRQNAVARELALHLALAALVLAATWLGYQADLPVRAPATLDLPGLSRGLNELEQSERGPFRWTDGDAQVCAAQAGRAARSVAEVALAGDYALAIGTAATTLQLNAGPPVRVELAPELRRYRLLSGADQQAGADLCLQIGGAAVPDPNNARSLGVPFYGVSFRQLPAAGPTTPAAGQALLNVILAGGALWLIRLLGAPVWVAAAAVGAGALAFGGATATRLVPAGAGLFGYMLPVAGGVVAAVAGVGAAWAVERFAPRTPQLARDLLGMAFWSALLVGGVWALQSVNGHHGAWPLKAGVAPHWTPLALLPAALFAIWLGLTLRAGGAGGPGDRETGTQGGRLRLADVALVMVGAVALPVALEVAVLGWDSLYAVFRDSPYDYQRDTGLVGGDPLGFLGRYVELAPTLALHNSNHPPGSVLLLWAVERLFGPGAVATSWAAILLSALAAAAALWLGWRMGGPRLAVLAGVIYAVMPGHMVFSVTSMDGVFNAVNALAAVAFFLCLEPPARVRSAVGAGALLALGVFFTYTTTQLFFFGAAAVALALYRRRAAGGRDQQERAAGSSANRHMSSASGIVLRQGAIVVGTLVAIQLLILLVSGFNIVVAARAATAENAIIVGKQLIEGPVRAPFLPASVAFYVDFVGANLAPYLWYLAPWGLGALSAALLGGARRRWRGLDSADALLLSVGACVIGMWLGGLFNREVERIWGFTYPLLAVLIARHALQGDARAQRWRAALYPTLFFAMSAVIKMLLNTAW